MTSSNVRLASSIIAHSSPRISTPCSVKRSGSISAGSLPSSASPSELASRRAGSIVTTATRAPSAAAPIATAAAMVVLPTPPEPAQTTIRFPSRRGREAQIRPSRTACATACERLRALSFVTTSCRTFLTVRSE